MKWLIAIGGLITLWFLAFWLMPKKHRDANDPNVRGEDFKWAQFWGFR